MTKFEKRKLIKETISILRKKGMLKENKRYSNDIQIKISVTEGYEIRKTAKEIITFLIDHNYESLLYRTIPDIIINTCGDIIELKRILEHFINFSSIQNIQIINKD